MTLILFFFIYFIVTFLFLSYLYKRLSVFYEKRIVKDKESGKEIDLGEKYDPFRPYDPINYLQFMTTGLIFFPIRALLSLTDCILYCIHLKILKLLYKHMDTNPKESKIRSNVVKFWSTLFLKISFISLIKKDLKYEEIYKKYLGPDYDFNQKDYSLLICNHIGFFDMVANMVINGCGFLAMGIVNGFPIGGDIARDIGGLFVERENEDSRKQSFVKTVNRQKDFYEKKIFNDLLVFPEGTTSNNQYIVKFKKGVFYSLLPLKPIIIHIDKNAPVHLCSNVTNLFFHVLRCFCCFSNKIYYCFLPIIKPTQYMYDNYSNFGKEKWEIYANVVKNMYAEIGGFKLSDLGHRDKDEYYEILESRVYKGMKI